MFSRFGALLYKNGDKYEGQFTKDKINGYGTFWKKGGR